MASRVELAWAAGIIDGEGCLHIPRNAGSLYLKVTMGHLPTVERLGLIFCEGSIQICQQPNYNVAWSWLVTTRGVGRVLDKIEPFLVTKAEEAKIAREFLALPSRQNQSLELMSKREDIWDRMRRAKPSFRFREARNGA